MNSNIENINQRLSLRQPLKAALGILAELTEVLALKKNVDLKTELDAVRNKYPTCTDFERDFVSICFNIATGVGKTRLMGACITYLHLKYGINNFFVLAPGTTIYNKLIDDFGNITNPKYVFKGIAEFVNNCPVIITGDNYNQKSGLFSKTEIRINVFNIAKFNRDIKPATDGEKNKTPRIKRFSEILGESYWDYLSNLEDLVILMDEAHRYHADKSKDAINELKPILGIELTATPYVELKTKKISFRNIVYEYTLAHALNDGLYIKVPKIATRRNYSTIGKTEEEVERIKLEDAIALHNEAKTALEVYALETQKCLVKPFILVVCKETTHAKAVYDYVSSNQFFEGEYFGKVLQIDSTTKDEDHIASQFLALESSENKIEIVIHVDMLKEGWDVTNLYTIVPLRAANAVVLIEQTIGRGLRLPYNGERTGNTKVDTLTIVAHDNFNKIIEAAENAQSIFHKMSFIELDDAVLAERTELVISKNRLVENLDAREKAIAAIENPMVKQQQQNNLVAERKLFEILPTFNKNSLVKSLDDFLKPEVQQEVLLEVKYKLNKDQIGVFDNQTLEELKVEYGNHIATFKKNFIEIPRMVLTEDKNKEEAKFIDFDLNSSTFKSIQHLKDQILIRGLADNSFDVVNLKRHNISENPVDIIVSRIRSFDEVDYDSNADLIYKLAQQAVNEIELYKNPEDDIRKIVFDERNKIAAEIYKQMMLHFREPEIIYKSSDALPFTEIYPWYFSNFTNEERKHFMTTNFKPSEIKRIIFNDFVKSCHSEYKFDSTSELTFAKVLEMDDIVLKWLRPAYRQFSIYWSNEKNMYEPDFVVETADMIYLAEIKRKDQIEITEVLKKEKAGVLYCENATEFTKQYGGKPWRYVLIPHDEIESTKNFNATVSGNIKEKISLRLNPEK